MKSLFIFDLKKIISEDFDILDILDILDIGRMNNMGQQGTQEWQTEVFRSSLVRWEIKQSSYSPLTHCIAKSTDQSIKVKV